MDYHIRAGQPKDIDVIAQFQIAMALETEDMVLDPEVVLPGVSAVFEDASKGFYIVAEAAGNVVGSLLITFEWSDWRNSNMWYIQSVFVTKPARGHGIFKAMYRDVVARAKEKSVMYIRLYVETENERAQKVYESLGMKRMPYFMYDAKIG